MLSFLTLGDNGIKGDYLFWVSLNICWKNAYFADGFKSSTVILLEGKPYPYSLQQSGESLNSSGLGLNQSLRN